jgi:hypothetical protein
MEGDGLAEWWERVGGVQQKDATNDEAIDCGQGYEDSRDSRMGSCGAEEAAGRGGHDRVHEDDPGQEHGHSSDSFGNSAQVGCNKEECELARSFGAEPMDGAYP